jgi:hypothetical protein
MLGVALRLSHVQHTCCVYSWGSKVPSITAAALSLLLPNHI